EFRPRETPHAAAQAGGAAVAADDRTGSRGVGSVLRAVRPVLGCRTARRGERSVQGPGAHPAGDPGRGRRARSRARRGAEARARGGGGQLRSEEHTSELQSRENLVCRLLLEKKNDKR